MLILDLHLGHETNNTDQERAYPNGPAACYSRVGDLWKWPMAMARCIFTRLHVHGHLTEKFHESILDVSNFSYAPYCPLERQDHMCFPAPPHADTPDNRANDTRSMSVIISLYTSLRGK